MSIAVLFKRYFVESSCLLELLADFDVVIINEHLTLDIRVVVDKVRLRVQDSAAIDCRQSRALRCIEILLLVAIFHRGRPSTYLSEGVFIIHLELAYALSCLVFTHVNTL